MSSPPPAAAVASSSKALDFVKDPKNSGILLSIAAVLIIGISMSVQFSIIDHGSSGQITIDNSISGTGWAVGLGAILGLVGALLYYFFNTVTRPYLWVFALAFLSFFLANFAIMMSLYQVQLTKV